MMIVIVPSGSQENRVPSNSEIVSVPSGSGLGSVPSSNKLYMYISFIFYSVVTHGVTSEYKLL